MLRLTYLVLIQIVPDCITRGYSLGTKSYGAQISKVFAGEGSDWRIVCRFWAQTVERSARALASGGTNQ